MRPQKGKTKMTKKEKQINKLKKQVKLYTKKYDNAQRHGTIKKYQMLIDNLEEKIVLLELQ
jgi:hypothetical protein